MPIPSRPTPHFILIQADLAFGFVFGQFSLFPTVAAFNADAVEEFACRFDIWVRGAPVGSQIATEGGA